MTNIVAKDAVDNKAFELLNLIRAKRDEVVSIETASKKPWKVPSGQRLTVGGNTVPVASMTLNQVREATMIILRDASFQEQADALLGLKGEKITVYGSTVEDWLADLTKRKGIIELDDKKKALAKLETAANGIISEDARRSLALQDLLAEAQNVL